MTKVGMVASRRLAPKANAAPAPAFDFCQERGSAGSYGSPVRFRRPMRRISRLLSGVIPRFYLRREDVSPSLAWSDVPPGVRSFALLCNDPDAPPARGVIGQSTTFPPTAPSLPKTPTAAPPGRTLNWQ